MYYISIVNLAQFLIFLPQLVSCIYNAVPVTLKYPYNSYYYYYFQYMFISIFSCSKNNFSLGDSYKQLTIG